MFHRKMINLICKNTIYFSYREKTNKSSKKTYDVVRKKIKDSIFSGFLYTIILIYSISLFTVMGYAMKSYNINEKDYPNM